MIESADLEQLRHTLQKAELSGHDVVSFSGKPRMSYAFFPGGNGLYAGPSATLCERGTLLLGSNFGCVDGFVNDKGELRCLDERANSTWKPLLVRLRGAGVPPEECFFTNAWPVLHAGSSNFGPLDRWLHDKKLLGDCVEFFRITLDLVKPRLIIALGTAPATFLSHVFEPLALWSPRTWKAIDRCLHAEVVLSDGRQTLCIATTHPSMKNSKHRHATLGTEALEVEHVRKAYEAACHLQP